jgi:hypothetical protein
MTQIILSDATTVEVLQQAQLKGYDNPKELLSHSIAISLKRQRG